MSAFTNSNLGSLTRPAKLASFPVNRLSRQSTEWPSAIKASQRCEPRKPAPPVTTARMTLPRNPFWTKQSCMSHGFSPDAVVGEAVLAHKRELEHVAPIQDDRMLHRSFQPWQINRAELAPVCQNQERIG